MPKSLATGSMSNHVGDVELQAIREETSLQLLSSTNNNDSQKREATQTGGNSSSSDSFTETERKLRGPLLSTESTYSLLRATDTSAGDTTSHSQSSKPVAVALEMEADPATTSGSSSKLSHSSPKGFLLTDFDSFLVDWAYTALIGFFVVSYWRVSFALKRFEHSRIYFFVLHCKRLSVRKSHAIRTPFYFRVAGYCWISSSVTSQARQV